MSYMKLLKANSVNFPPFLKKYLDEEFFPCYFKFIHYKEKPHLNKLDRTNNKTEGYFRATRPKGQKRKYRSLQGLINQIYHRGNGLIKNQRENQKKEKPKMFVR